MGSLSSAKRNSDFGDNPWILVGRNLRRQSYRFLPSLGRSSLWKQDRQRLNPKRRLVDRILFGTGYYEEPGGLGSRVMG
jgi:hypothetical protein